MMFREKLARYALAALAVVTTVLTVACTDRSTSPADSDSPSASDAPSFAVLAAPANFRLGDRVRTTDKANIRSTASASGALVGVQPLGAVGVIVAAPITDSTGDQLVRWRLDFTGAIDGWGADYYLTKVSAGTVSSITTSPAAATVAIGATTQLSTVATDSAGHLIDGTTMSWTSSSAGVASVSSAGLVTGVSGGTATITATSNAKTSTAVITVPAPAAPLGKFAIGDRVQTNGTANIRTLAAVLGALLGVQPGAAFGTVVAGPVTDAGGDKLVRWQIDFDQSVDGWAAEDYLVKTSAPAVPVVASVTINPTTVGLVRGQKTQLSAVARDASGSGMAGTSIVWASRDTLVAKVDSVGLVSAVAAGATQVVATGGGQSGTAAVTVTLPPVASVTITPKPLTVQTGKSAQVNAAALDASGASVTAATVIWTSRDTLVARVTNGTVVGALAGTTYVIASTSGKSDSVPVAVTPVPVASVAVNPTSGSVVAGKSMQLAATTKDASGNTLTGRTVTWSSSAPATATVSSTGTVTGVNAGTAVITAASEGKSGTSSITVTVPLAAHKGWYAAPNGTSSGDGSMAKPWNLATALSGASGKVLPGDTVWMRGGTYTGKYTPTLQGTPSAWTVVRQYPGERATLDGVGLSSTTDQFVVKSSYVQYMDFEVTNSGTSRYTSDINHNFRPNNIVNSAPHNRYVGLVVHDGGVGIYAYSAYPDVEINGCIFYNNGWDAPDRGHGHALYLKNDNGPLVARDNVIFDQYGYGIHMYTNNGDGLLNGLSAEGNISFNNGTVSAVSSSANVGNLGQPLANNMRIVNNVTYFSPGVGGMNLSLGSGNALTASGNYVIGGSGLSQGTLTSSSVGSNTVWTSGAGSQSVFVRPSTFVAGRAVVAIYSPSGPSAVTVSMEGVLNTGDLYVVHNVYALYGTPVVTGVYNGNGISIPITGMNPPTPIGGTKAPPATGRAFSVFVVEKN